MKPDELESFLARFTLTPEQLAGLSGRHKRTIYRYRTGEMPIPNEFAVWLRSIESVAPRAAGSFVVRFAQPKPEPLTVKPVRVKHWPRVDPSAARVCPEPDTRQRLRDRIAAAKAKA